MINCFDDFKLLINLGYSGEEIYELSFDETEREYIHYLSYSASSSSILDVMEQDIDDEN